MADNSEHDRINLLYETTVGGQTQSVELPFRLLVLGDFTQNEQSEIFEEQEPVVLSNNNALDILFKRYKPRVQIKVENCLLNDESQLPFSFAINSLDDFKPEQLIKNIDDLKQVSLCIKSLLGASEGVVLEDNEQNLIESMLKIEGITREDIENKTQNYGWLVSEFEQKLNQQISAIIHHPKFHEMESLWSNIAYLIEQANFDENCEIVTLNVSKQALMDDFDDVPETSQSMYYQWVYSNEFGQFGGRPYGAIIANYWFNPKSPDIKLLQRLGSVSAVAHAPFIAAAAPEFFDIESFKDFRRVRDLKAIFEQPHYVKWNAFRESEDARYVALTLPSYLLREAHQTEFEGIQYKEKISNKDEQLLWGNASFAYATRLLHSFAKYRWCLHSTGKEDGQVSSVGSDSKAIQTQIIITDKRESDIIEQGFMPLSVRKGDESAAFYSGYSTYRASPFGTQSDDLSKRLSAQLTYLFIICRFSQYLKVMQRENIGSWKNRRDLDQHLSKWLAQYVSDMDNPAAGVRARRPLRRADIKVREVEGKKDWFVTQIQLTPHLKFMGNSFHLSEISKMEKN